MSELKKGHWTLTIIESTKQWGLRCHYGGQEGSVHGGDSHDQREEVNDIIDLLKAYLVMQKTNYHQDDD